MKLMMAALCAVCVSWPDAGLCHPGSGIEVDSRGTIYFVDTGAGVWELSQGGSLRKLRGAAYHWMALDRTGAWSATDLPTFTEGGATLAHSDSGVLISSDFPISVDAAGTLFLPAKVDGELRIVRFTPDGSRSTFASVAASARGEPLAWINGSTVGPDGSFYYTEDHGVWKIAPGRDAVMLVAPEPGAECGAVPNVGSESGPGYRGIDVDAEGNVFVASAACRSVLKIAPGKAAETVLQIEGAWSPTDVATFGDDVYVLEYFHTPTHDRREWIPRVRRLTPERHSVIATVTR